MLLLSEPIVWLARLLRGILRRLQERTDCYEEHAIIEGGVSHAERSKQFAAWKLKQSAAATSTRAAFDKAHPCPPSTSTSVKDSVVSLSTAMDFLSLKQEVVREPRSAAEL